MLFSGTRSEHEMARLRVETMMDAELAKAIASDVLVDPHLPEVLEVQQQGMQEHKPGFRALEIYGDEALVVWNGIMGAAEQPEHPLHEQAVMVMDQPPVTVYRSESYISIAA